jgi:flagellar hook assembly protein FlgD
MQLSKDCLVTGTKETFCTGDNGSLHFFINGQENPNSLELKIKNEDNLLVKYE